MSVCTHLKGCAGCLVVFFVLSFPKWTLVVVEKHLEYCYLLIFCIPFILLFFFFCSYTYCRPSFYLGKDTKILHSIELTVMPTCKHR